MATLLYYSDNFDVAYEGVHSLRDIEISKIIESLISREEIVKNMRDLKSKLKEKSSQLAVKICQLILEKVNIDNLTWQKPLATMFSPIIQEKCKTFVKDFSIENINEFPEKNNIWKNPAFESQNAKSQSEGMYITDVIIPVIRSALKKIPIGKSAFINT
ncbi:hypothetical protein RhiirA4_487538 [Rhizophagus irregularis]|uniref:Uncharacterized protein n=1 Tax=Rhizophagus irregularis TaxID=588596 RepID=A0A2I1HSS4_9GLOM|nr:hypothetical protein RhiirA4_487538 [Rhizophagus irregularis]